MRARLVVVALVLAGVAARADGVDGHLLAGARAFRAQQYETALGEFQKVEKTGGAPDLALYLGPTLYKLGRVDEARQVLARMHRHGPVDAVADYYLGLCWHRLGLLRLARTVFAAVDAGDAGPKLAAGAARFVADIDAHVAATASSAPWLAAAETLERAQPLVALDDAEEAFLRAPVGSPERARAAAIIGRLGDGDSDLIARQAAAELAPLQSPWP
jgi:tetratricopeptide (TPR) repeat protein